MKGKRRKWDRAAAVGRARRLLLRRGRPRVEMAFILLLTGSAGFLLSYLLLHAGVTSMALRYPVVIFLSYGVFLLLLRAWLALRQRPRRGRDSVTDHLAPDLNLLDFDSPGGGGGGGGHAPVFGGAGDFGGGGAGGSWAGATTGGPSYGGGGGSFLGDLDLDLDLPADGDEGCLVIFAVLAVVAAVVAGLLASFYVIYLAPALLAEILVDGLLVAGLYRRTQHVEGQHWLKSVVRRTLLPVVLTLLCFTLAGYLMQRAAPEARSLAGFWESITAER